MAVCSKCGTTVPDEARFCPACGQAIIMVDVQPVMPEPEPIQYQAETTLQQESPIPQEDQISQPQNTQPPQSYYAQPQTSQSYYAQPQAQAPQPQSYYAQPQAQAPQPQPQSYYAQPQSQQPPQPQPQQSYYAQPQGQQPQPPQQSYYAQPQAPNQQPPQPSQNYYAPQNQNPQQNYYAPQNGEQPQYGYQQPRSFQGGPADVEENKGICVLSYLGILFLIPLLTKPNSSYVRFHSNQGLLICLLEVAIVILTAILVFASYVLSAIIGWLGWIFCIVLIIMGIINTVNGQMKPLPLIGNIKLIK